MLLDQDPPDTDNVFRVPYLDRWNLVGSAYKGFVRAYRQTAEGIRSSAGTANFISSDSAAYVATADDYNGTTNYALRGADYTSNANSKVFTMSFWFRVDGGNGSNRNLLGANNAIYTIRLNTLNQIRFIAKNAATTTILDAHSTTTFASGAAWYNVILSVDLATARVQMVIDGVAETPTVDVGPTDDTIDWTQTEHAVGAQATGGTKWNGCMSDTYVNFAESVDLDESDNIGAFISPNGNPVDLGADASFPTGSQPILAFLGGDPSTNIGFGGNLVNQAALSACGTSP